MGHPGLISHASASPRLCSLSTSPSRSPLSSASNCSSASTRIAFLTTFGNTCAPSTTPSVPASSTATTPPPPISTSSKGLTEGGRLCPPPLGLDIADLVTTRSLQRSVHYITLPPPDPAYFTAVLLYVDDFALLASYRAELLALMQLTLVRKQLPPLSVPGLGFPGRASASPRRRRLNAGGGEPGCCSSVHCALARGAVLCRHPALKGSCAVEACWVFGPKDAAHTHTHTHTHTHRRGARRSRVDDTIRRPARNQRSYAQPPAQASPARSAPTHVGFSVHKR